MSTRERQQPAQPDSLVTALVGDGRPLLATVAVSLLFAGAFAIFLGARGEFLPHDIGYLGQTADELRALGEGRVVDFMLHDRVAYGGALLAIGLLYLWLIAVPLGRGEAWAWWLLVTTGALGMATFLTYLGYGYLDSWHGWGTLALVPFSVVGAVRSRRRLGITGGPSSLRPTAWRRSGLGADQRQRRGWRLLLLVAGGLVVVGLVISTIGIEVVFVPEDIAFIGLSRAELDAANPRLVSLIAHDRAGFGGAILTGGLLATGAVLHAAGSRALWQAVAGAGVFAFGPAIIVHHAVGYTDPWHLAPAYAAAATLTVGLVIARP